MLDWSRAKTVLFWVLLANLPLVALLLLELVLVDEPGQAWRLRLACLGLSLLGSVLAAALLHGRLSRQVDALIDHCNLLALGDPRAMRAQQDKLPELGRLGLSIQVMRDVLVDYLSLYRRFFEEAPDMFLSLSPAGGRILDANKAFCRTVGLLRTEVLGRPVGEFVRLEQGWQAAFHGLEGLHNGTMLAQRSTIKIEASVSWEYGPQGQKWALGAMLRDVTLREELLRQLLDKSRDLERALAEAKKVDELKDQFLTTLSHELKTPLVAVKGFLDLLRQQRGDAAERTKYFEICWRNLLKLEKQINNLLDLARLSQGGGDFEMGPVNLAQLARLEAENLRAAADEKKIHLVLPEEESVPVWGNFEKLMQLVDNLLVNAIKYNRPGGEVRLDLAQNGGKVTLKVSDSGLGMDREHMAKIFNRFYRADMAGTGRIEGLGIGLSLVQEIVRLHQGDISVESSPGVGTTFTVELGAAE